MPEIISCPQCQRQLRVPDNLIGQPVKCPSCATIFNAAPAETIDQPAQPVLPLPPLEIPLAPDRSPRSDYRDDPRQQGFGGRPNEEDFGYDPGYRRRAYEPHRGALILVLGILSLISCAVLGPFAWVLGNNDMQQINAGRMDPEGRGLTQAGRICGIISTAMMVLGCTMFCLLGMLGGVRGGR